MLPEKIYLYKYDPAGVFSLLFVKSLNVESSDLLTGCHTVLQGKVTIKLCYVQALNKRCSSYQLRQGQYTVIYHHINQTPLDRD